MILRATLVFCILSSVATAKELCSLTPDDRPDWHYRTKIGGRPEKCWYIGERMKPRSELYWAEAPAIPPMREPWQLEPRFQGETE